MSTEYAKRVTPMGIPNTRLDDLPDLIDVLSCKGLHRKIRASFLA